uniref:Uncharacterized protein n=1 Tax=Lactuca sativa TaxID=4236 RepID=A0A9R1UIJ6_LACSA|nr:hypothetical protein LSAT_V11C900462590 [Lactuca sativa]
MTGPTAYPDRSPGRMKSERIKNRYLLMKYKNDPSNPIIIDIDVDASDSIRITPIPTIAKAGVLTQMSKSKPVSTANQFRKKEKKARADVANPQAIKAKVKVKKLENRKSKKGVHVGIPTQPRNGGIGSGELQDPYIPQDDNAENVNSTNGSVESIGTAQEFVDISSNSPLKDIMKTPKDQCPSPLPLSIVPIHSDYGAVRARELRPRNKPPELRPPFIIRAVDITKRISRA